MIEGLSYIPSFLDADEQQMLLCELEQLSYYRDTFLGKLIKRNYAQFGYEYGSAGRSLKPAAPFPPFLQQLADKGCSACHDPALINQCIITCYDTGSGIGWHTDAPTFGDCIFGVSLGASARFQFRPPGSPLEYELTVHSGSIYCMSGRARWDYQHRVPPVKATRYSLTFRTVREGVK
jgi:alkylated DNA repair protein (DNA oxidative demethylase)